MGRYLRKITALAVFLFLMVAVSYTSAEGAPVCKANQMLDEVEIVTVEAKQANVVWGAYQLLDFNYGGPIDNGLLEVSFMDIPTSFDFDGYIIEATVGTQPGASKATGAADYKTKPADLIARPEVRGAKVTRVLNLEPGTQYFVKVYAVNHNTVQISPSQRNQDTTNAVTLLTAPFLGALDWGLYYPTKGAGDPPAYMMGDACNTEDTGCSTSEGWRNVVGVDSKLKGTHFAIHGIEIENGQHYFRWLDPVVYGPFDHVKGMHTIEDETVNRMADLYDDGDGVTHYQFMALNEHGNRMAVELVDTKGEIADNPNRNNGYYQTVFSKDDGDITLSVTLGYVKDGRFKAMSDTSSVRLASPADLRSMNQTYDEYTNRLGLITGECDTKNDPDWCTWNKVDSLWYRGSEGTTDALVGWLNRQLR